MAPLTKQRISYVLPLTNDSGGHRLGVSGLAVDEDRSILYSAGRDGVICAWDVNHTHALPAPAPASSENGSAAKKTAAPSPQGLNSGHRHRVQAHTHWINDLVLAQSNAALVSASSDTSVKIWRPYSEDLLPPQTIGLHTDYVKRVASPGNHTGWVASGGLDRQVFLWDLNGAGKRLQINVASEEAPDKGSVYALAANESILGTGGPESIVKLWDTRSGKQITKFVGHTDIVRDLLISHDDDKIMSASSDRTVKVWSMRAGRCIHTLVMHNESVCTLRSTHPQLSVFYSGDRSGFVAKTDTRNAVDMDEGLSIALCKEHEGIIKIATAGTSIWTGTQSSSINRWQDVDMAAGVQIPEALRGYRWQAQHMSRSRNSAAPLVKDHSIPDDDSTNRIPFNCVLRTSNRSNIPPPRAFSVYSAGTTRKIPSALANPELGAFAPLRRLPIDTIEGQDGLKRHILLNDKQRVLTLDTTGNIMMWDLLKCRAVKSFGKGNLEEIASQINVPNTTAHWCTVDISTGTVTCTLDNLHGFDAEIYADETEHAKDIDFKEDQRINLGKWILRYLFASFLEEEMRRDEHFRRNLTGASSSKGGRSKPGFTLRMPPPLPPYDQSGQDAVSTPRAGGGRLPLMTPGLSIGVATPGIALLSPALSSHTAATTTDHSTTTECTRNSTDTRSDYFSQKPPVPETAAGRPSTEEKETHATAASAAETSEGKPQEPMKTPGGSSSRFGKRLLSSLNKSGKMFTSRSQNTEDVKANPALDDKADDASDTRSSQEEINFENTFRGFVQQMRAACADLAEKQDPVSQIESFITPSLPNETPVLKPPAETTVIIQEDRAASGGVVDLFEGQVQNLGLQADLIEAVAPPWLAEILLRNKTPIKEQPKLAFVVEPYDNSLPRVCNPDGSERLNANRMLRARKVAAYTADKLEPPPPDAEAGPNGLRPEEYIDLFCNDVPLAPQMTLAWIKSQIWKNGADIVINYKANGRKEIRPTGTQLWWDDVSASGKTS